MSIAVSRAGRASDATNADAHARAHIPFDDACAVIAGTLACRRLIDAAQTDRDARIDVEIVQILIAAVLIVRAGSASGISIAALVDAADSGVHTWIHDDVDEAGVGGISGIVAISGR